ncbi:MAG TPA: nucleoside deaminase [Bacteroidales bacterium]|nr:nucleoside deaminase [Bacteroidales bacterium]
MLSVQSDTHFMTEALREARKAALSGEVPVGAVVVCNGRIIARAHNMTETLNDATAHAEMLAITAAAGYLGGKYLEGCSIFVTLEPCPMCASALNLAQVERVVWAADDPKRGFSLFAPNLLHPKTTSVKGLLADEASTLLTDFFKARR